MTIRPYDAERDAKAVRRIWREVHWINSDDEEQMMDHFLAVVRAFVVELNGEAECLAVPRPAGTKSQQVLCAHSKQAGERRESLAGQIAAKALVKLLENSG